MIHQVYSSLPTFKNLRFRPGFNLLLAEKSPGATEKQTRNSAGKSSLIELLHFLLGADCDPKSIFRAPELIEHSFGMAFDLGDGYVSAERSGAKPSKLRVDTESVGETFRCLQKNGWDNQSISNTNWRLTLGNLMFGLKGQADDEVDTGKHGPSFRSLISYFVRRQSSGGFVSPVRNASMQQTGDYQVSLSYLLGLDWSLSQQWEVVRAREKALKILKAEAIKGNFGSILGTTADLRTQLTVAEEKVRRLRSNLNSFVILPEYRELESEASNITLQMNALADANTFDMQLITELESSFNSELPPPLIDLERLYSEAGIVLPNNVGRRFEDVRIFHESVVQNRKSYLGGELDAARRRIDERESSKRRLSDRYREVMSILKSHGALDHHSQLQSELNRQEVQTEAIRERFNSSLRLEGEKTELDIERDRLFLRLNQEFTEQADTLRHAIVAFEDMSSDLYEDTGSFTFDATRNGPQFEVRKQGDKSKGIKNMQIFCFDMMLMRFCSERHIGPKFLVHDSHLFDGCDERQVGRALHLGATNSARYGFQYIVTFNSDALPKELPSGFSLEPYTLPVRLTDATENGGLFGVRFG